MHLNIDTIGKRLFLAFSILSANVVIISSLAYYFIGRTNDIYALSKQIETQRIQIIRLLNIDFDFLRFEISNQEFYKTSNSDLIHQHDSLYATIIEHNRSLFKKMEEYDLAISDQFIPINRTLKEYHQTFYQLKDKLLQRGFKDYGLEGTMRKYVHELEKNTPKVKLADVLMMRRHEKDYMLRKELQYQEQLNALAKKLIDSLERHNNDDPFLTFLIKSYADTFNELTAIDKEIGLQPHTGLLGELNDIANKLSVQLETLVIRADARANKIISDSLIACVGIGAAFIIISLLLTYITALRLARPIKKLSNTIGKYMVTQGLDEQDLQDVTVTNEIKNLSMAFVKMTRKLKKQFEEIQRKSEQLQKQNYELQKLNEELDRFIYSSAHDLKSPLSSMEGLVHLAQKEINIPEHDHYFLRMKSSIEKMQGFIRDITDYAKNKRQQLKIEKIDIDKIVQDILQSLQFIPLSDNIIVRVDVSDGEFFTDRTRFEIILKNLLSNAFRYADHSKHYPYISVECLVYEEKVWLRVEDNGIGIDSVHVPKIFDMFYRAVDHAKGSGIGLFLVKESVKMLRGTIEVESVLDKGTTFTLHLPNLKSININQIPESEPIQLLHVS